jgi:HD-GYP domain-containing protein (c-di-GMP phosphodiesterase class II)
LDVADSFGAMTSDRPHRAALPLKTGIAEIKLKEEYD